jgi:hypothetical protein
LFLLVVTPSAFARESNRRDEMTDNNLEAFAISFSKLVQILDQVKVDKDFNVDVYVEGNSAMANAKGEADALGPDSHTETLSLTTTMAVQGVGSSSSSIAESLSLADRT